MFTHEYWMGLAFKEAEKAYRQNEIPVGAVVVVENRIIGRGYNQIETLQEPTAHAEMIALTSAAATLGSKWLYGATLYVTLEPCSMCAGAIVLTRLSTLVFGTRDPKTGACGSIFNLVQDERLNHQVEIVENVMENQCSGILKDFFLKLREKKKNEISS